MSTGGGTRALAAVLSMGAGNTFDLTDVVEPGAGQPYNHAWWTYTPTVSGSLHLDTYASLADVEATADTIIWVYTGASHVSNDDGPDQPPGATYLSGFELDVTAGTTYDILVGSYDPDGDTLTRYVLTASFSETTPPVVPPPPCYAIGGVTWPKGGQYVATAVPVGAPAVTAGDPGYLADDPSGFDGDPHLWWKWTAPASGKIIFDGTLSYDTATIDPASVNCTVYVSHVGPTPTVASDLTRVGLLGGATKTITVTAGTTYWVVLWNFGTLGDTGFILRVSDYGAPSPWITLADQAIVARDPFVELTGNHTPDVTHWQSFGTPFTSPSPGWYVGTGFHGSYFLDHSFNGNYPGTDSDAQACTWDHARAGAYGGQWWSLNPGGPNPASWNGTDPYDGGVAGAGTCVAIPGPIDSSSATEDMVGATGYSSAIDMIVGGGGSQTLSYDTYAVVDRLSLHTLVAQFGPDAGTGTPTDDPYGGSTIEWEAPVPVLLGIDVAPDETASAVTGSYDTDWYLAVPDGTPTGWTPILNPDTTDSFQGAAYPPTTGDLGVTYPATGGSASWTPVPDDVLARALTLEDDSLAPGTFPGLAAVAVSQELLSSTPPGSVEAFGYDVAGADYRTRQFMGLRTHLRPARHRWHAPPVLPPVEACDHAYLRIQPRDDAKNAGTAYRTFPPQHQSIRVHGGYPGGPGN